MSGWEKVIQVLPSFSVGMERRVTSYHFGPENATQTAYVQAGLHADEAPGYLVAHRLIERLKVAAERGEVLGRIVVVPVANPIGLSQWGVDGVNGRFDRSDQVNFNRSYPELTTPVAERVADMLEGDGLANVRSIRKCIGEVLSGLEPVTETQWLKRYLMSLSTGADIVLDLHCDHQALLHLYMGTALWPAGRDLAVQMEAGVTLLAEDSGGEPFDEANSKHWWELAEKFPSYPIPAACFAATVELRGIADTDPQVVEKDSANLFSFLQRRGFIDGEAPLLGEADAYVAPLAGVDYIVAPVPGVVSFVRKPGDRVQAGEVLATITDPLTTGSGGKTEVISSTDGVLFARAADRIARPGKILVKVAGEKPLAGKGSKLLTA